MIWAMETKPKREQVTRISVGSVELEKRDGKLWALHRALAEPVEISPGALERWVLRQLREVLA